jgi:Na+(H+)/acetate symporter ActP
VCFIFSCVLMVANIFWRSHFPAILQSPINCGAIAMLAGLVIVPVVSLFTPKPDKALVDEAFACYDKTAKVAQKTALGD